MALAPGKKKHFPPILAPNRLQPGQNQLILTTFQLISFF
jgi:hypothetical protein